MAVVGLGSQRAGTVAEVRDYDFLMERDELPGLYVPYSAIWSVEEGRVLLSLQTAQLEGQDWQTTETISR